MRVQSREFSGTEINSEHLLTVKCQSKCTQRATELVREPWFACMVLFVEGATTDLMLPKRAGQKRQLDKPSFFNPLFQRHNAVVGAVKVFLILKKLFKKIALISEKWIFYLLKTHILHCNKKKIQGFLKKRFKE
jgi:hypothetical protein